MRTSIGLRRALLDITGKYLGDQVGEQVTAVARLKSRWPHQITAVGQVNLDDFHSWGFNCHAFTFGYWKQELFWCLRETHPDAWPDSAFVTRCLLPGMQTVDTREAGPGAVVAYYEGSTLKHTGLLHGNLVESKWGNSHTWEHGLYEVPHSYGSRAQCYLPVADQVAMEAYLHYAEGA